MKKFSELLEATQKFKYKGVGYKVHTFKDHISGTKFVLTSIDELLPRELPIGASQSGNVHLKKIKMEAERTIDKFFKSGKRIESMITK